MNPPTVHMPNGTATFGREGSTVPKKILLIENERDIQTLVKIALEFTGKHDVLVADNGYAGLALADSERPDLILLDVMMPELDGFETLKRLRDRETTRTIPVIFLTARAQKPEIEKGLKMGAIGYITKPFQAMQLHEQIEACLVAASGNGDH